MHKKFFSASVGTVGLLASSFGTVLAQGTGGGMVSIDVPSPQNFRITSLGRVISSTFSFLLLVAGLLAFAYLVIGGIQWITSGGDKAGLESARNKIIHAIVGLIVVFSAWAITMLVQQFLGVSILGPLSIPTAYQ